MLIVDGQDFYFTLIILQGTFLCKKELFTFLVSFMNEYQF